MTGDLGPSAEASTEALEIYRLLGDRFGEANALRDLGLVRSLTGDYAEAEHHAREALAIYTEIGDPVHQAYALNELGAVRRLQGDLDGAVSAHEDALRKYADLGDRFGQANAVRHLGVVHRIRGEHAAAYRRRTRRWPSMPSLRGEVGWRLPPLSWVCSGGSTTTWPARRAPGPGGGGVRRTR